MTFSSPQSPQSNTSLLDSVYSLLCPTTVWGKRHSSISLPSPSKSAGLSCLISQERSTMTHLLSSLMSFSFMSFFSRCKPRCWVYRNQSLRVLSSSISTSNPFRTSWFSTSASTLPANYNWAPPTGHTAHTHTGHLTVCTRTNKQIYYTFSQHTNTQRSDAFNQ